MAATAREDGRIIRRYLETLDRRKARRTPDRSAVELRLGQIEAHLHRSDPVSRVFMIQERMNLQKELAAPDAAAEVAALEAEFIRVAAAYGTRRGLGWAAWREAGVPAAVLRRAGIRREPAG